MNIKNIKGFVMAEAIIVAIFILGIFTFMLANILPLLGEYERVKNYDTVGSKYDTHLIRKMLLSDNGCILDNLLTFPLGTSAYFKGTEICEFLDNDGFCRSLLGPKILDVKELIITDYNTSQLKTVANTYSREMNEYIKYIPKFTRAITGYSSNKRIVVVYNNGDISNIEILKFSVSCGVC